MSGPGGTAAASIVDGMTDTARAAGDAPEGRRLYAWFGAHPHRVDAGVAVVCAVLVGGFFAVSIVEPSGLWTALVQGALFVPLIWRRSRPFLAAGVLTVLCLLQVVFELVLGPGQLAVLVIIGANAARSPRWAARTVLAAGLVGIVLLAVRYSDPQGSDPGWEPVAFKLVAGWALVGVAWLMGDVARSRRLEREALAERAVQVERERARDRDLAAAAERRHIARELHDIVAHSLAVVVTQADGARYAAAGTPGPAVPALEAIAATARGSLDDMRRLLGVLRDGATAQTAPAERLDDLPAVVATVRRAGLDVRMRVEGTPRDIGPGAELVLHRVVQEALTNVLKHGGGRATADVLLRWGEHEVRVVVLDTGTGPGGPDDARDGGHGLLGMQERVAVYGGRFEFGSREGGGARLLAELPYGGREDA